MNKIYISVMAIALALTACNHSASDSTAPETGIKSEIFESNNQKPVNETIYPDEKGSIGDTLVIRQGSMVSSKLKFDTISNEEVNLYFRTTGIVKALPGNYAEISVPFDGRITRSFVRLGQKVAAGAPLFELISQDYLEYIRSYLDSRQERELKEKNYARKKELAESGIISKKELEEAKYDFELAVKEYEKCVQLLGIMNLDPEDANLASPLVVKTPVGGEVVRNEITTGQYLTSDSEPQVIIANLEKVRVLANVKERDLVNINIGDKVEIFSESMLDGSQTGSVYYIGNLMNEQTRSVEVFIDCANPGKVLKSGMFVSVVFHHNLSDAITIKPGAVMQDKDRSYIFLKEGSGTFIKKEVRVKSRADGMLIVDSGLRAGDVIVSEGGIYIK